MSYRDFLENPPVGVDPMPPLDEMEQDDLRMQLDELASVESLWR